MANLIDVNEANFESEVLSSDKAVLVDFWATWCAPCKAIAPLLEQLDQAEENLKVVKLDVQTNQKLAMKYGVTNIPTLLVFKGGQVVNRKVGAGGGMAGLKSLVSSHI